jgi:hypothetical protein
MHKALVANKGQAMREQATDAAMAAIGKNMAVGGGSSAVVFGLTIGDMAALGGLLVAIIGLGIQIYYKRKADRREAELHATLMAEHKRGNHGG